MGDCPAGEMADAAVFTEKAYGEPGAAGGCNQRSIQDCLPPAARGQPKRARWLVFVVKLIPTQAPKGRSENSQG